MTTGKLAVAALGVSLALGAGLSALADDSSTSHVRAIDLNHDSGAVRRDDPADEIVAVEDDEDPTGDGDRTRGNDGTEGGDNTGDEDRTRGNDGTDGGDNTGDGDATVGNDGTAGGDNSGDGDATVGDDGTSGGDNTYVPSDSYAGGDDSGDDSGGGDSDDGGT